MRKIFYYTLFLLISIFISPLTAHASEEDTLYVHKNGEVAFEKQTSQIDSVKINGGDSLQVYKYNTLLYSEKTSKIDSITFQGTEKGGSLRFAVISDTHFENNSGEGARVKVPKSLRNIMSKEPLVDAIIDVGDITNNGTPDQYNQLLSVFYDETIVPKEVSKIFLLGNHDNFTTGGHLAAKQLFIDSIKQPIYQYIDIKAYPFITISQAGTGNSDYTNEGLIFLRNSLEDAAKKYPGKPIFVFFHVPPLNTCYGSRTVDGWGGSRFNSTLDKYPQAITFSGHSHYPLGDPRSIYQNTFTAVNDGSTTYSEVEPNVVSEGIHPEKYQYVTEAVIVNILENGDVELERWDTYRNEEIAPRWTVKAPFDGTNFLYKNRNGRPAPVFAADAKPTISEIRTGSCEIQFAQATDEEVVHHYTIKAFEILSNGLVGATTVFTRNIFSQFYLNGECPQTITTTVNDLVAETNYVVYVYAVDSYNNISEPIISERFQTKEFTPAPDKVGSWLFDNTSDFGVAAIGAPLQLVGSGFTALDGPKTGNKAVKVAKGSHFRLNHGIATKNLDLKVNEYTLMYDFKVTSLGQWYCFLQTDLTNKSDGDLFIHNNNYNIGVGDIGYSDTKVTANNWYRLIVSVKAGSSIDIFLNGNLIRSAAAPIDGRFSLDPAGVLLFADDNGEDNAIDVAEVGLWDIALDAAQAKALGEPEGLPRFAVISDTHFENNVGEGAKVKVPQALKNIMGKAPVVDAIFDVGDITNHGNVGEYGQLLKVFNDQSIVPQKVRQYFLLGNHDNAAGHSSSVTVFTDSIKQPIHQYIDIKGFPFITISQTGTANSDYNDDAIKFLRNSLKAAAVTYPGKPIFVFFHVPPLNTCYGSRTQDGWGGSRLIATLEQYPQVITFSGHSHYPLGDPRSIHQNTFTAINDGSTTYSEVEPDVVSEGIHPEKYQYVTEAVIVNILENGDVELERWDTYRNEEIAPRWTVKAPFDGTNFLYKDRDGKPAPAFAAGAKPTLSDATENSITVTFPQATDDAVVHRYRIDAFEVAADGTTTLTPAISTSIFSQFYLNSQTPQTITTAVTGLKLGLNYLLNVYAIDAYDNVSEPISERFMTNVSFLSGVKVVRNTYYSIWGYGFEEGDKIKLTLMPDENVEFLCEGTVTNSAIRITIPEAFESGQYKIVLVRGGTSLDLGFTTLAVVDQLSDVPKVIAHRGYWDCPESAQNSIASLQKAQELNIYGAEFDVWITTDGKIVLNHDETINGYTIQNSTYERLENITLSNGEKLPTLESYLNQGKADPNTKLIMEIKTHSTVAKNNAVVAASIAAVEAAGLEAQVEYIAFSLDVCKEVLRIKPDATVAYLNGDRTPQVLYDLGIKGIDYNITVLRSNPGWINDAHQLGMSVNVWTVSTEAEINEGINAGVDYITSDKPIDAKRLSESF